MNEIPVFLHQLQNHESIFRNGHAFSFPPLLCRRGDCFFHYLSGNWQIYKSCTNEECFSILKVHLSHGQGGMNDMPLSHLLEVMQNAVRTEVIFNIVHT